MPTYVYETIPQQKNTKPRRFEVQQSMKDDPLKTDPETGDPVRRVISGGMEIPRGSSQPLPKVPTSTPCARPGGCACH